MNYDEKVYYEYRAKLTLEYLFIPKIYSSKLILKDAPDLVNLNMGIGVEITRSFFENFAEVSSLFHILLTQKNNKKNCKILKQIKKLGGKILKYNDVPIGYCHPAIWVGTKELKDAYSKKIKLLNKGHYLTCNYYDLYIISPGFNQYNEKLITDFLNFILRKQKEYNKRYRYVYIDDLYQLFFCNCTSGEIIKYKIPQKKVREFCLKSKRKSMIKKQKMKEEEIEK